jgi:hypothetical protein
MPTITINPAGIAVDRAIIRVLLDGLLFSVRPDVVIDVSIVVTPGGFDVVIAVETGFTFVDVTVVVISVIKIDVVVEIEIVNGIEVILDAIIVVVLDIDVVVDVLVLVVVKD